MKELKLSGEETRLQTRPYAEEYDYWLWECDDEVPFRTLLPMWERILEASEISPSLKNRITSMLPSQVNATRQSLHTSYNCYTLAFYLTDNFQQPPSVMKSGDFEAVVPPIPFLPSLSRKLLHEKNYEQIKAPEEAGGSMVVLTTKGLDEDQIKELQTPDHCISDLREPIVHAGIFLGSNGEGSYVFHKPGENLPEIRRLQTVVNGYSSPGEMSPGKPIKVEYWRKNRRE